MHSGRASTKVSGQRFYAERDEANGSILIVWLTNIRRVIQAKNRIRRNFTTIKKLDGRAISWPIDLASQLKGRSMKQGGEDFLSGKTRSIEGRRRSKQAKFHSRT